ncbi:hypothetical protein RAB80_006495 [Fusarium oxysporum f. sp. vasinfectum]|nr:hypothetical protein RAB80_006495 [Fusarium oxysporum f. sp. vasinfectum]KAK2938821.1 hypothetical protein FoTM2_002039 [Fusarium oxysporum f. sp. vasinfectum]
MTATIKRFYEDPDFPDQGTFDYPDYTANKLEDHLRPDRLEEDRYVIHETSYEVFEGNPSREIYRVKQHLCLNGLMQGPKDDNDPYYHVPALEDRLETTWAVVVKSRNAIAEVGDGNANRQMHFERTYQYEFDGRILTADHLVQREAQIRAAK